MNKYKYQKYLKSDHWKSKKKEYELSGVEKRCAICNGSKRLNLHHKNYKSIGNEKLDDLIYLCEHCHHNFHSIANGMADYEKEVVYICLKKKEWEITKKYFKGTLTEITKRKKIKKKYYFNPAPKKIRKIQKNTRKINKFTKEDVENYKKRIDSMFND